MGGKPIRSVIDFGHSLLASRIDLSGNKFLHQMADKQGYVIAATGVSQGGILGGGYVTLSCTTGLIDRVILESPGTPFALIMTRTIYFDIFKAIALLNIYNSRHLRKKYLCQMGWDVVEGSGALAAPVQEPCPRDLLHTGLGDVLVPALSAEGLARAFSASVLPNNPIGSWTKPVMQLTALVSL
jgi:hypothetical protein